jgi:hypothetical protein
MRGKSGKTQKEMNQTMTDSLLRDTKTERGMLCGIIFICYSTALASLVAFGYSLFSLALSAAGQQIVALYTSTGM